jgi:hypothetical protein
VLPLTTVESKGLETVAADIGIIGNMPRSITVNNTVDITLLNFLI